MLPLWALNRAIKSELHNKITSNDFEHASPLLAAGKHFPIFLLDFLFVGWSTYFCSFTRQMHLLLESLLSSYEHLIMEGDSPYLFQRWSITLSWCSSFSTIPIKCSTSKSRLVVPESARAERETFTPCMEKLHPSILLAVFKDWWAKLPMI